MSDAFAETLHAYNAQRSINNRSVACHAPFTNIYFNQLGQGIACCYNTKQVLGTYPQQSVHNMWYGASAKALRAALGEDDFSLGCTACQHQLTSGNFHGPFEPFDYYASESAYSLTDIAPPRIFEFSLTNTCNLGCVMCSGQFSSIIRREREHKPALKSPYDGRFVEQLEPFMPSLAAAKFYGGEPFLTNICYDIWDRLAVLNPTIDIHITTNGTILNDRVRSVLDQLNCTLIISIDSIVKPTYEQIRQYADFDTVMEHVDFFLAYSRRNNKRLNFAVCPMRQNWSEMPDLVRYCNEREIHLFFNTVYFPLEQSLRTLPLDEMDSIIAKWRSETLPQHSRVEQINRERFDGIVNQLEAWRADESGNEIAKTPSQNFTAGAAMSAAPNSLTPTASSIIVREFMRAIRETESDSKTLQILFTVLTNVNTEPTRSQVAPKLKHFESFVATHPNKHGILDDFMEYDILTVLDWVANTSVERIISRLTEVYPLE